MRIKLDQVYSRAGGIVIQAGVYDINDERLRGLGPYLVESRHAEALATGGVLNFRLTVPATAHVAEDAAPEVPFDEVSGGDGGDDEDGDEDDKSAAESADDDDIPEDLETLTVSELQALANTYGLTVTGTGKDGRVLKQDLIAALEEAT